MSSASLAAHRGRPAMPAYFIGSAAPRKSLPPPIHDIQIIRQTVVVNKNAPGPDQGHAPNGSPDGLMQTRRRPNVPNVRLRGRQGGAGRRSNLIASLRDGIHILPDFNSLRQTSVRQTLKKPASIVAGNVKGQGNGHIDKSSSHTPHGQNGNNTTAQQNNQGLNNIIIYRRGETRPIIIQTKGHITLSKRKTANGQTKYLISQNPSKTKSPPLPTTTTTLKPGEDPPEVENELQHSKVLR